MSAYDPLSLEQKAVLQALLAWGQKLGANSVEIESAVFTALREQDLHNLAYGSGTSLGWRQEIEGKGTAAQRMDLAYSIPHYYSEARALYTPGISANRLAEITQRPEKPYPEQAQTLAVAQQLIREAPNTPADFKFGPSPTTGGTLVGPSPIQITEQPDPKDSSPKIRASGKNMSEVGSSFSGHTKALRSMLALTVKLPS